MWNPLPGETPVRVAIGQHFGIAAESVVHEMTGGVQYSVIMHTVRRFPGMLGPQERMPSDDDVRAYINTVQMCHEHHQSRDGIRAESSSRRGSGGTERARGPDAGQRLDQPERK